MNPALRAVYLPIRPSKVGHWPSSTPARHTGQSVERIEADSERDRWFTAAEARGYGLVDHVVNRIGQVAAGPPAG